MASKTGIYGEVKSAIDAGRSKGVLSASQGGDLYQTAVPKIAGDKGSLGTAEADAKKAANGKIAAATADAYLGYGDYAKAAAMFELAKQKRSEEQTSEHQSVIRISDAVFCLQKK